MNLNSIKIFKEVPKGSKTKMEWLLIMNGSFPGLRSQKSSMYSKLESREYT